MDMCAASHCMPAHERAVLLQEANEILVHIPDANLDLECYAMCSPYAVNALFAKLKDDRENVLLSYMESLASSSTAKGLVGQMFELYLLRFFLPKGGPVMVAQFDQGEQPVLVSS